MAALAVRPLRASATRLASHTQNAVDVVEAGNLGVRTLQARRSGLHWSGSIIEPRFFAASAVPGAGRSAIGFATVGSVRSFNFQATSTSILKQANERDPKTFVIIEMKQDEPGSLRKVLDAFEQQHINLTHIESRLKSFARDGPSFHVDFEGSAEDPKVKAFLKELKTIQGVVSCSVLPAREVPWFPLNIRDLDLTRETLDGGTDLINPDHPGFHDATYKKRREEIVTIAHTYTHGTEIPRINYTPEEVNTWGAVYNKLAECHKRWACSEFNTALPQLEKYCGYSPQNIPQLADISDFLQQSTGFTLRPVSGLLSARDFLNALAFRVFFSTQYIRHHGNPFYTPEPDICHELLGHVPLFADKHFAEFSQEIGLASLAASDEDIGRLASVYWFTVEFGLLRERGELKAFGAGLLSSFGEMEWACSPTPSQECRDMGSVPTLVNPSVVPLKPFEAAKTEFPITTYQPTYFCADSMEDAKNLVEDFCDSLVRPFFPQYDALTQSIRVTKAVQRAPRTSTVRMQAEKQAKYFEEASEA